MCGWDDWLFLDDSVGDDDDDESRLHFNGEGGGVCVSKQNRP